MRGVIAEDAGARDGADDSMDVQLAKSRDALFELVTRALKAEREIASVYGELQTRESELSKANETITKAGRLADQTKATLAGYRLSTSQE